MTTTTTTMNIVTTRTTTKTWPITNPEVQKKISAILTLEGAHLITTSPGSRYFESSIDRIYRDLLFKYLRSQVRGFSYLEGRGWFMRNTDLQLKLLQVCRNGYGRSVCTVAGDFNEHLDDLLTYV